MDALTSYTRALRGPILITGASGFVGANLFKAVASHRKDVFALQYHRNNWRLADASEDYLITADVNDPAAMKNVVDTIRPQTVFDCVAYGAYSFEDKQSLIYRTNFQSIVDLVHMLSQQGCAAFVHAGSSSEYGTNCTKPSEEAVCEPNSDYAVSKLSAASFLRFMGKYRNFPSATLRLYSVYGKLEDTSRLVPNLLRKALAGDLPPFVDPRTSRDFVHVDDVCAAFVMTAVKMNPELYGEIFNIGSGQKTTIEDLAAVARRVFAIEKTPEFGTMEGRHWDLPDWYSDSSKAERVLGWRATIGLDEGLRLTAKWVESLSDLDFAVTANKSAAKRKRSLSAIVACYRDEEAIPVMHRRLSDTFAKLGIDYELIFVNDGSPDDSAETIRAISEKDPRVIGITHSRNFGSQMAFRSGMELSTKDGVVLLDGDLQDPPELIESFYQKWEEGFDVVYGVRVKRQMPLPWEFLYKSFYRVFASFSYVKIPVDAGDFSLIDRRAVGWLLNCPERDLFMRGLRAYVGFKQTGVDYLRPERMFGRSTNNLFRNIDWAKKGIFSFSNTPLTMLTSAGIVCLSLSLLATLFAILLRILVPTIVPPGLTTILIAILIFGSFNLFAVGLVGEYVAKIMTEVKHRPRLIRSALVRNGAVTDLLPDGKARST